MIPKTLSKAVQTAIRDGNTKNAIEILGRSKTIKANAELNKLYQIVAAQWSKYRKDEITRVQSEDFQQRTLTQINLSLFELVDGDLTLLDKIKPENRTSDPSPIKYFVYGILFLLAIFAGMKILGLLSPSPQPIAVNPIATKAILKEFKIYIINNQGATHATQAVTIFRDFTGKISISGTKYKIDRIIHSERNQLDFFYQNNGTYHYKYLLPSLEEATSGVNTNKGVVLFGNQKIANWVAEELPSNN